MVVTIILAIIAAIAFPAYQSQMAKGRRSDAINALSAVQQAQERLRSNQPSYALNLATLNMSTDSPGGHYNIALTNASAAGYTVTATPKSSSPQARDSDCAVMSMQMSGGNAIYSASTAASANSAQTCWPR